MNYLAHCKKWQWLWQPIEKKGLDSRTQAIAIINGFQGQLKYWWDNFFSEDEHNRILEYKRIVRNSNNIEVEEPAAAAALLINTITLHFLRNPKEHQASVKSILINLRCPTLSDYRWYKDVFLTNVLKRDNFRQKTLAKHTNPIYL